MSSPRALAGLGVAAFLVTAVVGGLWTALLVANLAVSPAVPWSVIVMAGVLFAIWRVLDGTWGPRRNAETRRRLLRANPLGRTVLAWALVAGSSAMLGLVGLWIVLVEVGALPVRSLPDYSSYPPLTVVLAVAMAAILGAVVEESMFRGYFQGPLELVVGGPAAIAITCLVMAPEHALTQGFVFGTLIFYVAVDATFGLTAYLAGSIVPGLLVHAVGLGIFFAVIWPGDAARPTVGLGGADPTFWLHVAQLVVFGLLAVVAFSRLARSRQPSGQTP